LRTYYCQNFATGKVHGSLARAGKVRGQTPKVEKQDKKKLPKGRAMKRIKYNRRFVNVGEYAKQLRALFCPCGCLLVALVQLLVLARRRARTRSEVTRLHKRKKFDDNQIKGN